MVIQGEHSPEKFLKETYFLKSEKRKEICKTPINAVMFIIKVVQE
jgi:hypothetical protein